VSAASGDPPAAGNEPTAASARVESLGPSDSDLPDASFDAPLQELDRDALSVFLFVSLTPEETTQLVKELDLSQPGFRRETLGEVQRCDLLADEVRAVPERRLPILTMLKKGWERPVLASLPLDPPAALDLLDACSGEGALPLALWRVLSDPCLETRAEARPFLQRLAAQCYGSGPREGAYDKRAAPGEEPLELAHREARELAQRLDDAERRCAQAEARAESARKKGDEAREKLQSWLKEARAREAQAIEESARAKELADVAARERTRLESELTAARSQEALVESLRLRSALKDLEARASAVEARLERERERAGNLEQELERVRNVGASHPAAGTSQSEDGETDPEEAPNSWLMPVYTREFYASLEGWDRRIQRAAFKQAVRLAQDHRHPSLRALPLEGLPGYYRVRVATDVRLLYRRADRQNTIEILSLIDREDLDRYIKQAKTRS